MLPVNVKGIEGEALDVTCRITSRADFDVSKLWFKLVRSKPPDIRINNTFIDVVDKNSVRLVYPNLSLDMDMAVLYCIGCTGITEGDHCRKGVMVYVGRKYNAFILIAIFLCCILFHHVYNKNPLQVVFI